MDVAKNPETHPVVDTLPEEERRPYVVACVRKQSGVSLEEAEERVAAMSKTRVAEIREAGRCGDVARVRELIAAPEKAPKQGGKGKSPQESAGNESENAD